MAGFNRKKKKYDFKEDEEKLEKGILNSYQPIFDYKTLEVEDRDKENLILLEKTIVNEGGKLGEIAYKIGESLEAARGVFKKYSTEENDPQSFVNWYSTLGLNKDQAYLFRGRYNLTLAYPEHSNNILALSDRAIKETIHKKTPEELKEKVVAGELTTGKAIVEQRTALVKMQISSSARNCRSVLVEGEILEAEIVETTADMSKKLQGELEFIIKDIKEREKNLRKLYLKKEEIMMQISKLEE